MADSLRLSPMNLSFGWIYVAVSCHKLAGTNGSVVVRCWPVCSWLSGVFCLWLALKSFCNSTRTHTHTDAPGTHTRTWQGRGDQHINGWQHSRNIINDKFDEIIMIYLPNCSSVQMCINMRIYRFAWIYIYVCLSVHMQRMKSLDLSLLLLSCLLLLLLLLLLHGIIAVWHDINIWSQVFRGKPKGRGVIALASAGLITKT